MTTPLRPRLEEWVRTMDRRIVDFDGESTVQWIADDLEQMLTDYPSWRELMDEEPEGPCIFDGCVSRERHWHCGFSGGYDNPEDPEGPPIPFTAEPAPGVRDYNGAILLSREPGEEG